MYKTQINSLNVKTSKIAKIKKIPEFQREIILKSISNDKNVEVYSGKLSVL
jgi:hypothetical protein